MSAMQPAFLTQQLWGEVYRFVDFDDYSYNDINKPDTFSSLRPFLFFPFFAKAFPYDFKAVSSPETRCLLATRLLDCMDVAETAIANQCALQRSSFLVHPEARRRKWKATLSLGSVSIAKANSSLRPLTQLTDSSHIMIDAKHFYLLEWDGVLRIRGYSHSFELTYDTAFKENKSLESLREFCSDKSVAFCESEGLSISGDTVTIRYVTPPGSRKLVEVFDINTRKSHLSPLEPVRVGPSNQQIFICGNHAAATEDTLFQNFGQQCDIEDNLGVAVVQNRLYLYGTKLTNLSFSLGERAPIRCFAICRYSNLVWMFIASQTNRINAECWDIFSTKNVSELVDVYDFNNNCFKETTLPQMIETLALNYIP